MEVPPGVLGLVDDMWFRYVVDVGMVGPDKGKGGKYLFLPASYKGDVPKSGYIVYRSPIYGLWAPFCNFTVEGAPKPAIASMLKHTRIYPLSEAGKAHGQLPNKNGSMMEINTIQPNTYQYWLDLNELVQEEGATTMGPEIAGQIAAIGIQKGKPFKPDARIKKILTEAAAIGNATARAVLWAPRIRMPITTAQNPPGSMPSRGVINSRWKMVYATLMPAPPFFTLPRVSHRPWSQQALVKARSTR